MRGRIRQLKPDLFLDDEFWMLTQENPELPLFQAFLGLWCFADREGRFEWKPAPLKAVVLPYWTGDFRQVLEALAGAGLLLCYVVDGRKYGAIRSFRKHQWANPREPATSLPPPPDSGAALSEPFSDMARVVRVTDATTPTPTPVPTPIRGVQGGEPGTRTLDVPKGEPHKVYLDAAVMAGVSLERAKETWFFWQERGLPAGGVRDLYGWLIRQAKKQGNSVPEPGGAVPAKGMYGQAPRQGDHGLTGTEKVVIRKVRL